jgi:Protein of unknown function (DUF3990)
MTPLHPPNHPPQAAPSKWSDVCGTITLWHGTVSESIAPICNNVDPLRGARATDFGRGFYTTTYEMQARTWAIKTHQKRRAEDREYSGQPAVIWFRVPLRELAPLHSLAFIRPEPDNELFWSLVGHCRSFPPNANALRKYTHLCDSAGSADWYDMVCGPVAADWPQKGKKLFRRQVYLGYDQYSFHTPSAVGIFNRLLQGVRNTDYDWYTLSLD